MTGPCDDSEIHIRSGRPCPRCGEEMHLEERGEEKLDICSCCGGIWFDPSELDDILGGESTVELLIRIKPSLRGEDLKCPICREYMETKDIFGIAVDFCRECGGIWLDSGETSKIWEKQERSRDPFQLSPDERGAATFWDRFREKLSDPEQDG